MSGTTDEENVTLTVTDTKASETTTTLTADDLVALTELIQQESSNTNSFNYKGIIIGSTLLGAGILLSLGTCVSSHSTFDKYKNRQLVTKLCSSLAIPLTTTGLAMTTFFVLNRDKTKCTY